MKVLITGSEGFIGRGVRLQLQWSGHEVVGIDRHPNADVVGGVGAYLSGMLDDEQPDVVLHLAALVTRAACEDSPQQAIKSNVAMTTLVARECARRGIKLAYASTSEVYGDHGAELVDEETLPRPTSGVYGMTKLWGEQVVEHYCERPLIMRLCMAYGPSMPVGPGKAALPTFIYSAIRGDQITVHRGAYRSWCFIDDMAKAIRTLIEQDRDGIWNVGRSDELVSMSNIALFACVLAGVDADDLVVEVDPPRLQTAVKNISCQKLWRETGWRPRVDLGDGMQICHDALLTHHRRQAA